MTEQHQSTETRRIDKASIQAALSGSLKTTDFSKLLEELKALKQRSYMLDVQKLEESFRQELDAAMKAAERRVRGGGSELLKAQAEERRIAESKHARDKELLTAKFARLDQALLSLGSLLSSVGPNRDMESKLHERETVFRKQEDDLNVQRKVFAREKDELDAERRALKELQLELQKKLANLDLVRRAQELDQLQEEFNEKLKSFGEQEAALSKQREELNRDLDKLGEARADVDRVVEGLESERAQMQRQKASLADSVAKEMAATFEGFVRDMLKESAAAEAAKPPPPPRKADPWGDLPP